tara:strand:- start:362 stop:619 length:258 start_codon:yes stop_codon:yes gene_type:complete
VRGFGILKRGVFSWFNSCNYFSEKRKNEPLNVGLSLQKIFNKLKIFSKKQDMKKNRKYSTVHIHIYIYRERERESIVRDFQSSYR